MKIISVLAGIVLTPVLYVGLFLPLELLSRYNKTPSAGSHDMWSALIGFLFYMPIILFMSSILTGFLIEPSLEKSWRAFVFYSPGLFFAAVFIILTSGESHDLFFLIVTGTVCSTWPLFSCLGVALGYKLRARIS
jgi:hypothetical protein